MAEMAGAAPRRSVFDRVVNVLVLAVLMAAALGTSFTSFRVNVEELAAWWSGFLQNFSTEMYGAFLTFLFIEVLVGGRQARQAQRDEDTREEATRQLQQQLANEARELQERLSTELRDQMRGYIQGQEIARLNAAKTPEERQPILDTMQHNHLLRMANLMEADLQGAMLSDANLQGADLYRANLQGADLYWANLRDAKLSEANLQGAKLSGANLQGAKLSEANLQGAHMYQANLQSADLSLTDLQDADLYRANLHGARLRGADLQGGVLRGANLQGALLWEADLQGADLHRANLQFAQGVSKAQFDEGTVLPDGTHWTPDTDIIRFTNPEHEQFWRSDDPDSPAYRGEPDTK